MARWTVVAGTVGAWLAAGCGSPQAPHTNTPRASTTPAATSSSPPVPALTDWRKVTFPASPRHGILMGKEPDGTQLIALDGFRAKQRGERVEFAKQVLMVPRLRSCRSGSGWLHVTSGRDAYWSDSFLGPLKWLGHADSTELFQCGPQVITAGGLPQLWSKQGPTPLASDASLGWASFSDAKQGVGLAFPDFWLKSSDGGSSFSHAPGAMSMAQAFAQAPRELEPLSDEDIWFALRAWQRRALVSEAGRAVNDSQLTDGTAVRIAERDDTRWVELRKPDGSFSSLQVNGTCEAIEPWGSKLVTLCGSLASVPGRADRNWKLRSVYPTEETFAASPRLPVGGLVVDREGRYIFTQGAIDYSKPYSRPLMRFDGQAWQVYEQLEVAPVAMQGGWLLLEDRRLVPAEHPEQAPIALATRYQNVRVDELRVLEQRVVFVRRSNDYSTTELVELELPSGRELKVSPYPTEGRGLPAELSCEGLHCSIDDTTAWTRLPDGDEPEVLPTPAPTLSRDFEQEHEAAFELKSYACELVSNVSRKDEELRGYRLRPEQPPYPALTALPGIGGMLRVAPERTTPTLSWHGTDAAGAFSVTTRPSEAVAALQLRLPRTAEDDTTLQPVLVARHFLLANETVDQAKRQRLLVVSEDGGVRELVPPGAFRSFRTFAVPLPDGRSLLQVDLERYAEVLALDSDGSVRERRSFLASSLTRYVAVNAGVAGVAFLGSTGPKFFSLTPETPSTPLQVSARRALDTCRSRKPNPNALTLYFSSDQTRQFSIADYGALTNFADDPTAIAVVEAASNGCCLRGAFTDLPTSTQLFGGPWLQGLIQGQTKSYKLTCHE